MATNPTFVKGIAEVQQVKAKHFELELADFTARNNSIAVSLPPGSEIIGGAMLVVTAANTTGTATVSIGDAASATRYMAATNVKAVARTALTVTGFKNTGRTNVLIAAAFADATTTVLKIRVTIQYVVLGEGGYTEG
jgi:hypothetical protein